MWLQHHGWVLSGVFTPGLDLGPCSTPGPVSPARGWVLEYSDEETLARGGMRPGALNTAQ